MAKFAGIRQGDSPLRYWVKSRSRGGKEHLTELDAYGGIGKCECEDFTIRKEPAIRRGEAKSDPAPYRCWHLEHARDHLLQKVIEALVEQRRASGVHDDPHESGRHGR